MKHPDKLTKMCVKPQEKRVKFRYMGMEKKSENFIFQFLAIFLMKQEGTMVEVL